MSRDAIRPTLDRAAGTLSTLLALDVLRLLRNARKRGVSVSALSAELKAGGITISSAALAKYLSSRSSNSAKKRTRAEPHGQVKTGTKEPEHRESGTGPK